MRANNSDYLLCNNIGFCRLQSDKLYSDAIFQVTDQKFSVHKCVLACRCPQLHEKIQKRLDERKIVNVKSLQVGTLIHCFLFSPALSESS